MSQAFSQIEIEENDGKHTVVFYKQGFVPLRILAFLYVGFCMFTVANTWREANNNFVFLFGSVFILIIFILPLLLHAFGKIKVEIDGENTTVRKPRIFFWLKDELKTSQVKQWYFIVEKTLFDGRRYYLSAQLQRGKFITLASKIRLKSKAEADALTQMLNDSTKFYQLQSAER